MSLFSHPFFTAISELANAVEKEWADSDKNFDQFSGIAYKKLSSNDYSKNFSLDYLEILKQNQADHLPALHYSKNKFSDYPITLIRRDGFFIDLYVWENSYTDIHNHHFAGAFQVLYGGGINFCYAFENEEKIEDFLYSGNLKLIENKTKCAGVTFEIRPGDGFIHQSLHALGTLSITLCIRTENNPSIKVFEYFMNGFKLSHFYLSKENKEKMDLIYDQFQKNDYLKCDKLTNQLDLHFKLFCLKDFAYLLKNYDESFIKYLRNSILNHNSDDYRIIDKFKHSVNETYIIFQKLLYNL